MDSQAWPHAACVRLFHSSGDVGCRVVTRLAQKLPLVSVDSLEALERALSSMDEELVAIVMKDSLLSAKAVEMFTSSKKVGGVVLVRTLASGSSVSPDVTTPQGKNTPSSAMDIDSDFIWNPMGSGLMSLSLSFPVVLLEGETAAQAWAGGIANLVRGVQKYPRSSAAFDFYFGAEGLSSLECLQWVNLTGMRSPKCLPIGGQSAWGTAGPPDGRPLVLLTSGMDSSSLFHDRYVPTQPKDFLKLYTVTTSLLRTYRGKMQIYIYMHIYIECLV
jgi:nicastrin